MLVICGSARNDGTCPGEISKTFRLVGLARETLEQAAIAGRRAGPEPASPPNTAAISIRVGMPCDGDVVVALALEALPEPRVEPDQRLDGGDLRTLDCRSAAPIVTPVSWYPVRLPCN